MIAVSCGTPTPATIRVVQIEPGPIPTFTPSAPASISALVASAVATLPAITCTELDSFFTRSTARATSELWPCAVSITITSHSASISCSVRVEALVAHRGRGGDAQAAGGILGRIGIGDGLLDVLDRDQADAAVVVVDHQQLLDPALVEQLARFLLRDAGADRGEIVVRHQLAHRLLGIVGEAHVAVGEDADQLARGLDHRDAADPVGGHHRARFAQRRVGRRW